ncbi:MAG TPA: hypothetical protein VIV55_07085 [Flavobacterium sp.]
MKKLFIPRFILYNLCLFIVNICAISCVNQEKEYDDSIFETEATKFESTIDFSLIDCLNECNKKNIELSSITFSQTKDSKTLQLLLKIKKDHQKIDSELKKLTEKNLIIIPKLIYNLNLNSDSLKSKNANFYLSNLLKTEITNQITILDQIEKTTQNIDFRIFAIQSKKIIQTNNNALKKTLNI